MSESGASTYDLLPYASSAYPQTHPDKLAAIGKLFGMQPVPPDRARVLEIACAGGGNLIPMAAELPNATFLGIDLSARQIAEGHANLAGLHLPNVELRQMDIAKVDASLGKFDYIIAHGVYSWVSRELQDKLMTISRENLSAQGIAYISYNTNPGWRMRGMIRDTMVYHAKQFSDVTQQVQQARALLDFLATSVPNETSPYAILLKQELAVLRNSSDSYLLHEFLEEVNEPLYFHQFAERATAHGLQYLGESEFHMMLASNFPPQVVETLRKIAPDLIRMEQCIDFLHNRSFRQSLLVHQGIALNRNLNWRNMEGLHVASSLRPVAPAADASPTAMAEFRGPRDATFATPDPVVRAAFTILSERWPQTMALQDLRVAARARVNAGAAAARSGGTAERDAEMIGADLLKCVGASLVEARTRPYPLVLEVSGRPRANEVARLEASKGHWLTNLRHEPIRVDEFCRQIIRYLDGTRDHAALIDALDLLVVSGELVIRQGETPVMDPAAVRKVLAQILPEGLVKLAKQGFLEA